MLPASVLINYDVCDIFYAILGCDGKYMKVDIITKVLEIGNGMIQFIACKHPYRLFSSYLVQDLHNISLVLIVD